jgi:DNA-binding response OmpR family regulator
VRTLVTAALRRRGYHVLDAPSGGRAAEVFGAYTSRVHLLLTDVMLGAGSGPALANRLKATDPLLQVLYMSGSTGATYLERPGMAGMPFIQKPFTLQALVAKVREVLDRGDGRG